MTTEQIGQYAFDDNGEVYVAPTKLTETAEAWMTGYYQGDLEQYVRDTEALEAWTEEKGE